MLWLKAFHVISMVAWFAGLFYLPRLYVYHAMSQDRPSQERFKIMESKLYYGIMMPAMLATVLSGSAMVYQYAWFIYHRQKWLHVKIALVALLIVYQFVCGHKRKVFARDANQHSHVYYRWFNEVPTFFLLAIIILVIVKPF